MAYRFQPGEPVNGQLRRIVLEEIDNAVRHLGANSNRDVAIHEARKSLKKIRAALRLVRQELGRTYTLENARFRRIARMLSPYRDASVVLETIDALIRKTRSTALKQALRALREKLDTRKQQHERSGSQDQSSDKAAAALSGARGRVVRWVLEKDRISALSRGFNRSWRRARKAWKQAKDHPAVEHDHTLRRRVKDLWYQTHLLEPIWPLREIRKTLKDLESALGDAHNLTVLRADAPAALHPLIDHEYGRLRDKAFSLSASLFSLTRPL